MFAIRVLLVLVVVVQVGSHRINDDRRGPAVKSADRIEIRWVELLVRLVWTETFLDRA